MGNRCLIAFKEKESKKKKEEVPCIYLHWNGGRDSVEAFLDASKRLGVRTNDQFYGMARMTQIISNYLGGTLSIGISNVGDWDLGFLDNGVYWVDGLEIYDRTDTYDGFEEQKEYDHEEMVQNIIARNSFVHEETEVVV
tara:strand:+ start:97 stop:513 length:417 start_codon:yes stop_codon:yes gene_type:complete